MDGSFSTLAAQFLEHCRCRGLSEHTKRAYRQDLEDYERWLTQEVVTELFAKETITGWITNMHDRQLAPASIKRRIACLKVLCSWLEEGELIELSPFHKLKTRIRLPRRLPRNLTKSELKQLLNQAASQTARRQGQITPMALQLSLEILFATGVRIGELCNIRLDDLDLPGGTIRIKGKGNRERHVYLIDDQMKGLLEIYLGHRKTIRPSTDILIITGRGTPAQPDYLRRQLHKLVDISSLTRRVTPHMIRHSAATQLIEAGTDIRFVQKLLGHSSISTTEIYTHVSDESLKSAIAQANPRRRLD